MKMVQFSKLRVYLKKSTFLCKLHTTNMIPFCARLCSFIYRIEKVSIIALVNIRKYLHLQLIELLMEIKSTRKCFFFMFHCLCVFAFDSLHKFAKIQLDYVISPIRRASRLFSEVFITMALSKFFCPFSTNAHAKLNMHLRFSGRFREKVAPKLFARHEGKKICQQQIVFMLCFHANL